MSFKLRQRYGAIREPWQSWRQGAIRVEPTHELPINFLILGLSRFQLGRLFSASWMLSAGIMAILPGMSMVC